MIYDFLVIGGGIAGTSVAYELAAHGSVVLLETETSVGYHSTGRSAALFTRNYGGAVVRKINTASEAFFKSPPTGFCDTPLLTPRGALSVSPPGEYESLSPRLALSEPGEEIIEVTPQEALNMAPFLRLERIDRAIYEANVSDIDVASLLLGYMKGAKARGAEVHTNEQVIAMSRQQAGHWKVDTPNSSFYASIVINAAGAWADQVGNLAGARPIGLIPKRRSAIIVEAPSGIEVSSLPCVDFISGAYIKPEAGHLMVSPGDATPDNPKDVRPTEIDIAVLVDWLETETQINVNRLQHSWAGLRSFVADETPVMGFDPEVSGFFWLAGFGGFGIMMAPTLAMESASICISGKTSSRFTSLGLNETQLAPHRLYINESNE